MKSMTTVKSSFYSLLTFIFAISLGMFAQANEGKTRYSAFPELSNGTTIDCSEVVNSAQEYLQGLKSCQQSVKSGHKQCVEAVEGASIVHGNSAQIKFADQSSKSGSKSELGSVVAQSGQEAQQFLATSAVICETSYKGCLKACQNEVDAITNTLVDAEKLQISVKSKAVLVGNPNDPSYMSKVNACVNGISRLVGYADKTKKRVMKEYGVSESNDQLAYYSPKWYESNWSCMSYDFRYKQATMNAAEYSKHVSTLQGVVTDLEDGNSKRLGSGTGTASNNGEGGFLSDGKWKTWAIGGAAVGGLGYMMMSNKDKEDDKKKKQEAYENEQQELIDQAQASIDQATACAQTGSENFPGCQSYLADNCGLYYGSQYAPFALIEAPSSSADPGERATYEAQKNISGTLQGICAKFETAHCGTEDEPTSHSGSDVCTQMNERTFCLKAGNAEAPSCIRLANASNPICKENPETCAANYDEAFLASACETHTEDPICKEYIEDQIAQGNIPGLEEETSTSSTDTTTTASADSSFYGGTNSVVGFGTVLPEGADPGTLSAYLDLSSEDLPVDIAPASAQANTVSASQLIQQQCAAGLLQGVSCGG